MDSSMDFDKPLETHDLMRATEGWLDSLVFPPKVLEMTTSMIKIKLFKEVDNEIWAHTKDETTYKIWQDVVFYMIHKKVMSIKGEEC